MFTQLSLKLGFNYTHNFKISSRLLYLSTLENTYTRDYMLLPTLGYKTSTYPKFTSLHSHDLVVNNYDHVWPHVESVT